VSTAPQRLLVFDVCGSRYALKLEDVAEVLEPTPTFPVPRVRPPFRGAINLHGRLVAVLDLAAFLRIGSFPAKGKYIVFDRDLAHLALGVGTTVDIVTSDLVLEEEAGSDPLEDKVLILPDGEVRLLHPENLLYQLEDILHG
jgi:purine-binding chemotaxis protein CheW